MADCRRSFGGLWIFPSFPVSFVVVVAVLFTNPDRVVLHDHKGVYFYLFKATLCNFFFKINRFNKQTKKDMDDMSPLVLTIENVTKTSQKGYG